MATRRMWSTLAAAAVFSATSLATVALTAFAAEARLLISQVQPQGADGTLWVEVTLLNTEGQPKTLHFPDRIAGMLTIGSRNLPVELVRAPESDASRAVPQGGFAQAGYRLALPEGQTPSSSALLALVGQDTPGLAFSLPAPATPALPMQASQDSDQTTDIAQAPAIQVAAADPSPNPDTGNLYIGNISSYAPI